MSCVRQSDTSVLFNVESVDLVRAVGFKGNQQPLSKGDFEKRRGCGCGIDHLKVQLDCVDVCGRLGVLYAVEERYSPLGSTEIKDWKEIAVDATIYLKYVKIELDGPGARAEVERRSGVGRDEVRRHKRSSG